MYTKQQYGKELKKMVEQRKEIASIGARAHKTYYEHISEIDIDLGEFLLQLGTMEMGPEFEPSYEELEDIADRLIAGEDVKL